MTMLVPLGLLAFGSVFAGFFGSHFLNIVSVDNNFFAQAIFILEKNRDLLEEIHHAPFLVKISPLLVGVVAIALAYFLYLKRPYLPEKLARIFKIFYKISYNKWYFDEIYEAILVKPTKKLGLFLWKIFDVKIVDNGGPNSAAEFCREMSVRVSKLQTGYLYHYATWMVIGCITIIFFLIISLKEMLIL